MDANREYLVELEIKKLQASRRDTVERVYARWKLSLSPLQWQHLPSVFNVCRLAPFVPLINADASVTLSESDFQPAMENLSDLITAAFDTTKSQLLENVMVAQHPVHDAAKHTQQFKQLQLATMLFQCGSCRGYLAGFDSVKIHNCDPSLGLSWGKIEADLPLHSEFPYPFTFSAQGASLTAQILHAIGLDPMTTTASQLAAKDCVFRCLQCLPHEMLRSTFSAFSWMALVSDINTWWNAVGRLIDINLNLL